MVAVHEQAARQIARRAGRAKTSTFQVSAAAQRRQSVGRIGTERGAARMGPRGGWHWTCQRGCDAGGSKRYPSAVLAARYAEAFDREDRADLVRRAPLVAGLPLRIARALRRRTR
jgi:hypothetical protein